MQASNFAIALSILSLPISSLLDASLLAIGDRSTVSTAQVKTVTGVLRVIGEGGVNLSSNGSSLCFGINGYGDIGGGATIEVTDGDGEILALGSLGNGTWKTRGVSCAFPVVVDDVPVTAKFYRFKVGRRTITTSRENLEQSDWRVEWSLY